MAGTADHSQGSPVAFLIYNRPETTRRVFARIAEARPSQLLVVADGPHPDRPRDLDKCAATRAILDDVDWECRVMTNFADQNLGCKRRISSGLDWVFNTVERAIILEDDTLPHPTFFQFCNELLDRYADDDRVGAIGGSNFISDVRGCPHSYYFSQRNYIWGWASWARAWRYYDADLKRWPEIREDGSLGTILRNDYTLFFWYRVLADVYEGRIDTWDYQWAVACWMNGMSFILPAVNLIRNIGFAEGATHTSLPHRFADMEVEPMKFPLAHPPSHEIDREADELGDTLWGISPRRDSWVWHSARSSTVKRLRPLVLKFRSAIRMAKRGQWNSIVTKTAKFLRRVQR